MNITEHRAQDANRNASHGEMARSLTRAARSEDGALYAHSVDGKSILIIFFSPERFADGLLPQAIPLTQGRAITRFSTWNFINA
jgi:hypothetical protein